MPMLVGQLIAARAIQSAVLEWGRAGGGAAGWAAASRILAERFPQASRQAITAVIGYAQDQVRVGARYQRGGDSFTPELSSLPDVRPALRRAGLGPPEGVSGAEARRIYHQIEIRIIDPANPGALYNITFRSEIDNRPLSRAELMQAAAQQASQHLAMLIASDPDRLDDSNVAYQLRIVGSYIGY